MECSPPPSHNSAPGAIGQCHCSLSGHSQRRASAQGGVSTMWHLELGAVPWAQTREWLFVNNSALAQAIDPGLDCDRAGLGRVSVVGHGQLNVEPCSQSSCNQMNRVFAELPQLEQLLLAATG